MHTIGALVLAIVSVGFMHFVLGFLTEFLILIMYDSIGIVLPILMGIALTGCAYFGGLYFSLSLVPLANAKITTYMMVALVALGGTYGVADFYVSGAPGAALLMMGCSSIVAIIGFLIARAIIEDERSGSA